MLKGKPRTLDFKAGTGMRSDFSQIYTYLYLLIDCTMNKFGGWEILLIVLAILLLFGGRKIPELMKGLGKGIREFKTGVKGEDNQESTPTKNN